MLGPAELREIHQALHEERHEQVAEPRSPYLNPAFAVGVSVTRAIAGGIKQTIDSNRR